MPTSLNFSGTSTQFVPSQLRHDSNGWYLTYYTYNPIFDGLERKRVRLNQLCKRCRSVSSRMKHSASCGCIGKSGVSTSARPANASRNAIAGTHCPLAQKPCRNNIFFISLERSLTKPFARPLYDNSQWLFEWPYYASRDASDVALYKAAWNPIVWREP